MKKLIVFVLWTFSVIAPDAFAMSQQGCGGECSGCHKLTVKEANTVLKGMGGEVKQVKTPPIRGLWELEIEKDGKKAVAYIDFGKKHIIPGTIYTIATRTPISAAANQPAPPAKVKVASIPVTSSIVMGNPKGKKKLFVFTDPECPFCAKLHGELKKLTDIDNNLAIYVKLFPLKMHPHAYEKARAILQGNSAKLLDDAFMGLKLPDSDPKAGKGLDDTIKLAQSLGITATPTLVLPDGRVMPGYRDAAAIKQLLSGKK